MLQSRESLEQAQDRDLAPYAVKATESKGRKFDEKEHDYRTCFQRDRDRVIHCSGFRRLDAKTQVFYDSKSDYTRTRLTHTIEVTQIARTLARILSLNEDLAETASLAHDLGHPPYGHCGEYVLDDLMEGHGGFEHNAQSLRVVEYLEHPYPEFRGLNLSYEVLECLAKHESRYDRPDLKDLYGTDQAPLEGQIADLADSIAYNSHDLDDALFFGLIDEEDLKDISLYQQFKSEFDKSYPDSNRYTRRLRCAKRLIDLLVSDTLEESNRLIGKYRPKTIENVRNCEIKLISLSEDAKQRLDQLSDFLYKKVYMHPDVAAATERAKKELGFLFNYFVDDPNHLPSRYESRVAEQGIHKVVCDYLAGMTDRYCHTLYENES